MVTPGSGAAEADRQSHIVISEMAHKMVGVLFPEANALMNFSQTAVITFFIIKQLSKIETIFLDNLRMTPANEAAGEYIKMVDFVVLNIFVKHRFASLMEGSAQDGRPGKSSPR